MSILIVDDSEDSQILLQTILKRGGYINLRVAGSAQAAFELLRLDDESEDSSVEVDLILMDFQMEGMNGIEACRHLKRNPRLRDIPIIMVTASDNEENLHEAFAAGAIDYIHKPIRRVELLARVGAELKFKHEMDQRKARERELLEVKRQLEEANTILHRLSFIDGLTGIANRRRFDEFIEIEWKRAARERIPVAVVMMDLDHFKRYNVTLGHEAGDQILRRVGSALNAALRRPTDLAARYGGEEFIVALPNADEEGARVQAERLHEAIADLRIPHPDSVVGAFLTVSAGAASAIPPIGDSSPAALLAAADRAMYEAKRQGRNRVSLCAVEFEVHDSD